MLLSSSLLLLTSAPYSLVSSQNEQTRKWKSRAIKLKGKTKTELERPWSPCTPTKRGFPLTSDTLINSPKKLKVTPKKVLGSPRRMLDSPKVSLPNAPKSRFSDASESSGLLSRSYPKQFFDNSSLGIVQGELQLKEPTYL